MICVRTLKKLFASFIFAGSLLDSTTVFAHGAVGPVSLVGVNMQINSSYGSEGYVYVPVPLTADSCVNNVPVLVLHGPQQNAIGKEIYTALLMAKASGKRVIISTTGCWSTWSTPVIVAVSVLD